MTTAEQAHSAVAHPAVRAVSIAGVPWPAYKLAALLVAALVLAIVGLVTGTPAAAVLSAAAVATIVWLAGSFVARDR